MPRAAEDQRADKQRTHVYALVGYLPMEVCT